MLLNIRGRKNMCTSYQKTGKVCFVGTLYHWKILTQHLCEMKGAIHLFKLKNEPQHFSTTPFQLSILWTNPLIKVEAHSLEFAQKWRDVQFLDRCDYINIAFWVL